MRLKHYRIPLYQRLMVVFRPQGDDAELGRLPVGSRLPQAVQEHSGGGRRHGVAGHASPDDDARPGKDCVPAAHRAAVTIWKIIKGALIVAAVGIYGLLAYVTLIVGTIGYGWRSFFGYKRTKEKYQLSITQNLYYQKLDGNLGAILCG